MTDIVIYSAGPSRFTLTESALLETTPVSSKTTPTYAGHVSPIDEIFSHHSVTSNNSHVSVRRALHQDFSAAIPIEYNRLPIDHRPSTENTMQPPVPTRSSSAHPIRFHNAKEMFQTLNRESMQSNLPLVNRTATHQRRPNEGQTSHLMVDQFDSRRREIPVQVIQKAIHPSASPTSNYDDHVQRKFAHSEQHYDFPADVIEQWRKHQYVEHPPTQSSSKLVETPMTARLIPSIIPSNVLKRMDHLNTVFIKPTRIEQPLPKLIFQENDTEECSTKDEQSKSIDTTNFDESEQVLLDSRLSSPLFYEQAGIPEVEDDTFNDNRRVKFSTAPIRVYPTYAPSEYDRRNENIDPFSASAEYELEKRIEKMDVFQVDIEKGSEGLGMSVLGMGVGADSGLEKLGIFVKALNPQGVIAKDGRIQVGDQIIEVNEHDMVGVTHLFATNVLKNTAASVKFVIGREKDPGTSEVLRLIQRSLQMDQERDDTSHSVSSSSNDQIRANLLHQATNTDENSIEPMGEPLVNEYEMEILRECFESLEKTLESVEKEKEYFQQLYRETLTDFQQMQEKYIKATDLLKELQDQQTQAAQEQVEKHAQQQKRIQELIKKIEELEQFIASAKSNLNHNSSHDTTGTSVTSDPSEPHVAVAVGPHGSTVQPSTGSSNGQTLAPFTTRSDSTRSRTTEQDQHSALLRSTSENSKSPYPLDSNMHRILPIDETQVTQLSPMSFLVKYSSKSLSERIDTEPHLIVNAVNNNSISLKVPPLDVTHHSPINDDSVHDEYVEVKDWTSDRCIQWLTTEEMTSFIPLFLSRGINGEKLVSLDSTKMKAMGMKSSKDRDRLKAKLKELKHADLDQIRERLLPHQPAPPTERPKSQGSRFRSSSLTKFRDRRFFSSMSSATSK